MTIFGIYQHLQLYGGSGKMMAFKKLSFEKKKKKTSIRRTKSELCLSVCRLSGCMSVSLREIERQTDRALVQNMKIHRVLSSGLYIYLLTFWQNYAEITLFTSFGALFVLAHSNYIKINRTVQEEPQAEVAANPWHQQEEKKWHRLTCVANKQMHDKHKDQLPLPKANDQNAKRSRKEQGKTKHEAPCSVNYRATQNKNNIGTTALERSVVYITGGFKGLSLHTLHPCLGTKLLRSDIFIYLFAR